MNPPWSFDSIYWHNMAEKQQGSEPSIDTNSNRRSGNYDPETSLTGENGSSDDEAEFEDASSDVEQSVVSVQQQSVVVPPEPVIDTQEKELTNSEPFIAEDRSIGGTPPNIPPETDVTGDIAGLIVSEAMDIGRLEVSEDFVGGHSFEEERLLHETSKEGELVSLDLGEQCDNDTVNQIDRGSELGPDLSPLSNTAIDNTPQTNSNISPSDPLVSCNTGNVSHAQPPSSLSDLHPNTASGSRDSVYTSSVQSQSTTTSSQSDSSYVVIDGTSHLVVDASSFEESGLFYGSDLKNRTIVHEDEPPPVPPESADDVLLSENVMSEVVQVPVEVSRVRGDDTGSNSCSSIEDTLTDSSRPPGAQPVSCVIGVCMALNCCVLWIGLHVSILLCCV